MGCPQHKRLLVSVGADLGAIGAWRELGNLSQRGVAAILEDEACQRFDAVHRELIHHLHESAARGVIAGTQ
jgi:hypothetical protein